MNNRLHLSIVLVVLGGLAIASTQCSAKLADGFSCSALARSVCERASRCKVPGLPDEKARCVDSLADSCSDGAIVESISIPDDAVRDCATALEDTACGAALPQCTGVEAYLGCGAGFSPSFSSSSEDEEEFIDACPIAAAVLGPSAGTGSSSGASSGSGSSSGGVVVTPGDETSSSSSGSTSPADGGAGDSGADAGSSAAACASRVFSCEFVDTRDQATTFCASTSEQCRSCLARATSCTTANDCDVCPFAQP